MNYCKTNKKEMEESATHNEMRDMGTYCMTVNICKLVFFAKGRKGARWTETLLFVIFIQIIKSNEVVSQMRLAFVIGS